MAQKYAFQPKVNVRRRSSSGGRGGVPGDGSGGASPGPPPPGSSSPFDRLYAAALQREAALAERRAEAAEAELNSCTFHPVLAAAGGGGWGGDSNNNDAGEGGGLVGKQREGGTFQRLYGDALVRRDKKLAAETVAVPVDPDCTFEPRLSLTTRRITERLRGSPGASAAAAATQLPAVALQQLLQAAAGGGGVASPLGAGGSGSSAAAGLSPRGGGRGRLLPPPPPPCCSNSYSTFSTSKRTTLYQGTCSCTRMGLESKGIGGSMQSLWRKQGGSFVWKTRCSALFNQNWVLRRPVTMLQRLGGGTRMRGGWSGRRRGGLLRRRR